MSTKGDTISYRIAIMTKSREGIGIGRYTYTLHKHLKKIVNIDCFYYDFPGWDMGVIPSSRDINVIKLAYPGRFIKSRLFSRGLYNILGMPGKYIPKGYDIYHFSDPAFYAFFRKKLRNARVVVSCHDLFGFYKEFDMSSATRRNFQNACRRLSETSRVICGSKNVVKDLKKFVNLDVSKAAVIHYGVDPAFYPYGKKKARKELGLPQDKLIILHTGTEARRKNVHLILEALKNLRKKRSDFVFVRVGFQTQYITDWIRENKPDFVIRPGEVSEKDLVKHYSAADIFVFPSSYENGCLPPLESMACGVPVIGSDRPSVPEMIGDAGIVVSLEGNGLEKKIELLLNDKKLRKELGKKSLDRIRLFDWNNVAARVKRIYDEILE
jgi:glycosyltransferase involved in cell wall biosynthesis